MTDIADRVKTIIAEHLGVEMGEVIEAAHILDDLGGDSLDTVELVIAFEEVFDIEIHNEDMETVETVGDAIKLVERIKAA